MAEIGQARITLQGKTVEVPSIEVEGSTLISRGRFIKVANIMDEEWEEPNFNRDPARLIEQIKQSGLKADLFTFSQQIPDATPRYPYHLECGNLAVASIKTYESWWTDQITQVSRKNVRRAAKRGVSCRVAAFDEDFLKGVVRIYNETPVRQGRRFWHYGKDLDAARNENATFLDRSDFIGAYYDDELIGFIKIVYVGMVGKIMQILSMNEHQDKRPTNALIAKAVEVCAGRGISYFVYGSYVYEGNVDSPLIELKRRMGFDMVPFPKYFVPLTGWGSVALKLNLHHGIKGVIPPELSKKLRNVRAKWHRSHIRQPGESLG
jgi:hypothetical protein